MNKNRGKRIKMSLYTVGTLFRKGRKYIILIDDDTGTVYIGGEVVDVTTV